MTTPLFPDATRCPDCRSALTGGPRCAVCGLRLTGPEATRLWELDVELGRLEHAHRGLLWERRELLQALRPASAAAEWSGPAGNTPGRQEWTPQRVQNLLLSLGGLLLAGAALVFAAVTYERLGATGRALVLAALTLATAAAAPRLRARGLSATAEALGGLTLVLAALDAYGLRTLGLAQDSHPLSYAAGSAAALSLLAGAYGRLVPLHGVRLAAVVLTQLPVPLLLVREAPSAAVVGATLALLAAVDLAALAVARAARTAREVRDALGACTTVVLLAAVLTSLTSAYAEPDAAGALPLLVCAAVLAGGAVLARDALRSVLGGTVAPVLAAAAGAPLVDDVPTAALALGALGLAAVLAAGRLPRGERTGPLAGALLVSATAVLLVAAPAVEGVLGPLSWLGDPWSLSSATTARDAFATGLAWSGTVGTPAVLSLAGGSVLTAGWALQRVRPAAAAAGALGLVATLLLPVALDLPYVAGLALLLLLAATATAAGVAQAGRSAGRGAALAGGGTAVALHAAAWSLAAEGATLVVLPLAAVLACGRAAPGMPWPAPAVGLAGLLGAAELGAAGAAGDLAGDQVGALLVLAVAVLLGLAAVLDSSRRTGAEGAALGTAAAALGLADGDVGWLSWTLAGLGLLALATALRPDRRPVAVVGGLLLAASSWVRLADAGVSAPEPYVLPLSAAALVLGHLRRRADAGPSSWAAYGPGLTLALVPSLVASLDDQTLTRPLLLGLASLGVLLVGARTRLQAPLAVGATVLVVDALDLLGPYAVALPRWLSLGAAGALLLVVGATYEQRRRDVSLLRDRYDALA